MYDEGVIKFEPDHETRALSERQYGGIVSTLAFWRQRLARIAVVGQDASRYGGAGFGNLSARVHPWQRPPGRRRFLITGSQTGASASLTLKECCIVESCNARENRVQSHGPVLPSSETMTHAAIYDLSPSIRFVFHGHAPALWHKAGALRLPASNPRVAYGTQEMAVEIERLYRTTALPARQILAMGGHEDGVIAFGHSATEAGAALLRELAAAYEIEFDPPSQPKNVPGGPRQ